MKLARKRKFEVLLPIASMGDIAFLLIIFFMLTSNFIKEAHVELTPPKSEDIEKMKQYPVSVAMDEDGEIWLQGEVIGADGLEGAVNDLLDDKAERIVVVKIDKELTEKEFRPVLMSLSKTGAEIALTGTLIE